MAGIGSDSSVLFRVVREQNGSEIEPLTKTIAHKCAPTFRSVAKFPFIVGTSGRPRLEEHRQECLCHMLIKFYQTCTCAELTGDLGPQAFKGRQQGGGAAVADS